MAEEPELKARRFKARLKQTVFRIQDCIQVPRPQFMDMLGASAWRFGALKMGRADFSTKEVMTLADSLDLDPDLLLTGDLDFGTLARQFRGDLQALPERYCDRSHHLTRAKSAQVIFAHLCARHGEAGARAYFRRLQLHPEAFANAAHLVSPMVAVDLLRNLRGAGYNDDQFRRAGVMTFMQTPPPLRGAMRALRDPKALYTYFFEHVIPLQYDRVLNYRITRLTDSGFTLVVSTRQEARDAFMRDNIDNRESCLYRQGVISSVLGHHDGLFAGIHEKACVFLGDTHCEIEFSFH